MNTLQCARCGDVLSEREVLTEPHSFGAWMTQEEPTVEREGLRRRVCEACGAAQSETIEKLRPTPEPESEPTLEPESEPTPEWTYEPTAEPGTMGSPDIQTNDEPKAEPTPTREPAPEPTPGYTPSPALEATPKPTPKPAPKPTPKPTPGRIRMTGAGFGHEATAAPSPDTEADEREDGGACRCCCCRRSGSRRRNRWKNTPAREGA